MLTNQYNFSPNAKTVTQVVANLGAIIGGEFKVPMNKRENLTVYRYSSRIWYVNRGSRKPAGNSLTI